MLVFVWGDKANIHRKGRRFSQLADHHQPNILKQSSPLFVLVEEFMQVISDKTNSYKYHSNNRILSPNNDEKYFYSILAGRVLPVVVSLSLSLTCFGGELLAGSEAPGPGR